MYTGSITDVEGIWVGNAQDRDAGTGVTVIYPEGGAAAGVDVRGGGPGTRETDALACGRLVEKISAVMLSGGSAFGLAAAEGIMKHMEMRGIGYDTKVSRVPIVPGAVIFDLGCKLSGVRPDAAMGALACMNLKKSTASGSVGAGTGATVGKLSPGLMPAKGGLGTASMILPGGAVIGAISCVNCAGDVYDPYTGELVGGAYTKDGRMVSASEQIFASGDVSRDSGNTTISVIATDATLTREQCNRLALLAHDGYARAIRPVHLPIDGDTVFALSTARKEADFMMVSAFAAEVMARAICNAVLAARGENL